jgi:hypothetical protein
MTTTKKNRPLISESSRIYAILLRDLMKRGVCQCGGGDVPLVKMVEISSYLLEVPPPLIIICGSKCPMDNLKPCIF